MLPLIRQLYFNLINKQSDFFIKNFINLLIILFIIIILSMRYNLTKLSQFIVFLYYLE